MNYRILVVGEGKHFGLSTACLYVTLAGEYGMTDVLEMPRGEYQTETTVRMLLIPPSSFLLSLLLFSPLPSLHIDALLHFPFLLHSLSTSPSHSFTL